MKIFLDFETRSELSLPDVGAFVYTLHPSTEILCLSWRTKDDDGQWISETTPSYYDSPRRAFNKQSLERLFKLIADRNNTVEAHNAFFEKCIWWHICEEKLSWPTIDEMQWRCSAAKAASCALPRSLGDAGNALGLSVVKDEADGARALTKLSKAGATGTKEEWEALYAYNHNDTLAEMVLSDALPDLTRRELRIWQVDQRMNRRGIPVDVAGARKAVRIAEEWTAELNEELRCLTARPDDTKKTQVQRATQRKRLLGWLDENGIRLPNSQAITLDLALPHIPEGKPKRVVEIMRSIGRSSVAKYQTLIDTSHGNRLHDTQMYHGSATGRWSGKRFQPHNLPRGKIKTMDFAWSLIHDADVEMIRLLFGDPMEFLSHALRGAVFMEPGEMLYSGDYAAVESRVLFWCADAFDALKILSDPKQDIYLDMASRIYKRRVIKSEEDKRQFGKQCLGADTLVLTSVGVLPIVEVTKAHKVWDGEEWVSHEGLVCRGMKRTIDLLGVSITPEHPILQTHELKSAFLKWLPAVSVGLNINARCRSLATASECLPSGITSTGLVAEYHSFWRNAIAEPRRIALRSTIYGKVRLHVATFARNFKQTTIANTTTVTPISSPTKNTERDCLTASPHVSTDAITQNPQHTNITENAVSTFTNRGEKIVKNSYAISRHLKDGINRIWSWIEQKLIEATSPAICDLLRRKSTCRTKDKSQSCKSELRNSKPVYDIADAGPRHRFTILTEAGPLIVHNSILGLGFGMGFVKFLITCRVYKMKFSVETVKSIVPPADLLRIANWIREPKNWIRCEAMGMGVEDIPELCLMKYVVDDYRALYGPTVCKLWYDTEDAAKNAMANPGKYYRAKKVVYHFDGERFLTCQLPSGRKLYYPFPKVDADGITYMGVESETKQWIRERTYGGKLVENYVQAIARDVMADAAVRIEQSERYSLLMMVHDELVAKSRAGNVDEFTALISKLEPWAEGMPIRAESWCGLRYRK